MSKKDKLQVILLLVGMMIAGVFIYMYITRPITNKIKCNDGWSIQTRDGEVVYTYIEELDECKEENENK